MDETGRDRTGQERREDRIGQDGGGLNRQVQARAEPWCKRGRQLEARQRKVR
jgi:hypothetical protein